MKVSLMTPNLERRLTTLIGLEEKRNAPINSRLNPTITISREYGCEAFPLANILKSKLEKMTSQKWTIYDKALIKEISSSVELKENFLEHIGDSSRFLDFMASFTGVSTHSEAYQKMSEYIGKIALQGNAIIIGRGAGFITKELENCIHFRLEAPFSKRVASIANRLNLTLEQATQQVITEQTQRDKFIQDFFKKDIRDIKYYDAILNDDKLSKEEMLSFIMNLMQKRLDQKSVGQKASNAA